MAGGYYAPKWSVYGNVGAAQKPPHHSLFGNLLRDVVAIPKGIPAGIGLMATHPIRAIKQMGEQTAHTYSPLIHGQFGKFYGNFHAHPLQPILDAVSVATLAAGGIGAGIKGADTVINTGRAVEYASIKRMAETGGMGESGQYWTDLFKKHTAVHGDLELRAPKLNEFANRFRKGTKYTQKDLQHEQPGYLVYKHYSQNLFTRAMQRYGFEAPLTALGKLPGGKQLVGEGGKLYDYSMKARSQRAAHMDESQRAAATAETMHKQFKFLRSVHKETLKRGLHAAGKEGELAAAHEQAIGSLIKAVDNMMNTLSIKVDARIATDIVDSKNFPFQYRKDVTTLVPKETIPAEHPLKAWENKPVMKLVRKENKHRVAPPESWDNPEDFKKFTKDLGERVGGKYITTNKVSEARITNGQVELIRTGSTKGIWSAISDEAQRTSKLMHLMGTKPVKVWKYAVLSFSPRYFVNNLSNYLMYAMSANPVATTRGIIDAIRMSRGPKAADEASLEMNAWLDHQIAKYTGGENGWYQTHFAGIHATTYGSGIESGSFHKVAGFGFKAVEDLIYGPSMRAGTMASMRSIPKVRALENMYRDGGMTEKEAFNAAAARASADRATHSLINKMVGDWAGQYYHLNGLEQKIMAVVPFYNWDRHALRFAKSLVVQHPTTAAVLGMAGVQGNDYIEKKLGKLPDFMMGALPIGRAHGVLGKVEDVVFGSQQSGRDKILLTHGLNPLSAAGENIHALAAIGGAYGAREALGSQANPLIAGLFEGATGENITTGAKVHKTFLGVGGPLGAAAHNIFATPAPAKMLLPILHAAGGSVGLGKGGYGLPKPKPNARTGAVRPFLYSKSQGQNVRSWIGINSRDFDRAAAEALYNEQHHIKKGRTSDRKFLTEVGDTLRLGKMPKETSGFITKRRTRTRKASARTKVHFPALHSGSKKGLRGIGGIGGL